MRIRAGRALLRVLTQGAVECLLFFPLLCIPGMLGKQQISFTFLFALLLVIGYGAGWGIHQGIKQNHRWKRAAGALLWTLSVSSLTFGITGVSMAAAPFIYISFYRGGRMGSEKWSVMFPGSYFLSGLILYGLKSLWIQFSPPFQQYQALLTWMGAVALTITLLWSNRSYVEENTLSDQEQPVLEKKVLLHNQIWVWLLLVIIAAVVLLPQLRSLAEGAWHSLLSWLASWLKQPEQVPPAEPRPLPEGPPPMLPGEEEASQTPAWMRWAERFFMNAVLAIAGIGALYILYKLMRNMNGWLSRLSRWLQQLQQRSREHGLAEGFEDTVEVIKPERKVTRHRRRSRPERRKAAGAWAKDHRMAVRQLYQQFLLKSMSRGYRFKRYMTPRETLEDLRNFESAKVNAPEELTALYEKARYGNEPINQEHIQHLKRLLKKTKKQE
ncbi:DUF4129 domain-containing protein [Paenibacillus sp. JSM ZJ436]|uniref:DUF4129 domain-containing protein n=1 Tax=Paenibacillus sp. JSM ZJ436 TaxID=3376190 RepID=UPI00379268A3